MTLPAAPPLSIAQIVTEFGIATPAVFPRDFYGKGGAPATGALSFSDFLGRSNVAFSPTPGDYSASGSGSAGFTVDASVPVVWTFTKDATVTASVASGATGTEITFTITATGVEKTGNVTLTATLNGSTFEWTISLDATGRIGG